MSRVDTRVQLADPLDVEVWTRDDEQVNAPRLEPHDAPAEAVARRYVNWPWKDDVLRLRRAEDGTTTTVCAEPECAGRRETTLIDSHGWTTRVSDPTQSATVDADGVDLQFVATPGRGTSLYGWLRTPRTNVVHVQRTTGPKLSFGSGASFLVVGLGAVMLGLSIARLADHKDIHTGAALGMAIPGLALGTATEVFGLSGLFIPTRTEMF